MTSKSSRGSPTGSVKSEWSFPYSAQDNDPTSMLVFQYDSDANSTASSIPDLRIFDEEPPFLLQRPTVDIDAILYNPTISTWK